MNQRLSLGTASVLGRSQCDGFKATPAGNNKENAARGSRKSGEMALADPRELRKVRHPSAQ
jgi:hypothetical protein